MGKKIYQLYCECCDPPKVLKNYFAKQYHLKTMAKKRNGSSISAENNDSEIPPASPANRASVNYICFL